MAKETKSLVAMMSEVVEIERALIETGGELTPEMEERFNLAGADLEEKVDRYYYVIEAMGSRAEYFRSIERQAQAARKVFESQEDRLKANLKYAIEKSERTELLGHDYRYKLIQNKPRLSIDRDLLPAGYLKEETVMVPDKALIENDLALGISVAGCEIVHGSHVRPYVNGGTKAKHVKGADNE